MVQTSASQARPKEAGVSPHPQRAFSASTMLLTRTQEQHRPLLVGLPMRVFWQKLQDSYSGRSPSGYWVNERRTCAMEHSRSSPCDSALSQCPQPLLMDASCLHGCYWISTDVSSARGRIISTGSSGHPLSCRHICRTKHAMSPRRSAEWWAWICTGVVCNGDAQQSLRRTIKQVKYLLYRKRLA